MKKIILISVIALNLNFNINAEEQINEFECSPEEMTSILNQDKIKDRVKQTTYSAFSAPYQEASTSEKSGKQPDELTQTDKEKNDGGLSCLSIDMSRINDVWSILDNIGQMVTDGYGKATTLYNKLGEELTKGFCERAKTAVTEFVGDFGEKAKEKMEERIREESWGKILDGESGADYLINEQIDKSFSDKNDLLNWRNGGFDKEKFKNNSKSVFQDEISDIYDDFDDQVDKKSGIK